MTTNRPLALGLLLALLAGPGGAQEEPPVRPPPPPPSGEAAPPPGEVSKPVFVERLTPYGRWVDTPEYGRVFAPNVASDWRPYYYGRWVLTDWGWTWVSDEPFGWAVYHYGRWNYGPSGWFWIPGRVWGPAWVSWRWNAGYVAWVPLGPRRFVWGVNSPYWVAVRSAHFTSPVRTVAIPVRQTSAILVQTRPLAGAYARPQRGMFGPPVAHISRATGQRLTAVSAGKAVPGGIARNQAGAARGGPPGAVRPHAGRGRGAQRHH